MPKELFEGAVEASWRFPNRAPAGTESNVVAQRRGLAALMGIVDNHRGQHIVVSTHGTLMALMINGLDPSLAFEFWRGLSFPDVYALELGKDVATKIVRLWPE